MRLPAFLLVGLLSLAACTNAEPEAVARPEPQTTTTAATTTLATEPSTTTTTPPSTTTTTFAGVVSPLNGLPADPELADRRVIAVKIDNHWNARPQSGIQHADAVYELLVEAGLTRFIALFGDNDTDFLGPMRSGRPTDPTLLAPLGATFAISGAQDWVIGTINRAGVPLIGEIRPATFRVSFRRAPHNLYVDTGLLREAADARGYPDDPPPPMFSWATWDEPGEPATEIVMSWSSGTTITWRWTGAGYQRMLGDRPHTWRSKDGQTEAPITADTLVVLVAPRYWASGSSGSAVPAMDTTGSGEALVFADGQVKRGTWQRSAIDETFTLLDDSGNPLSVPPGVPWISIFPTGRTISW